MQKIFVYFREIIETMVTAYSQKIFQGQKPVFDGRKNLYSRDPLPVGRDKVCLYNIYVVFMYNEFDSMEF